MKPSDIVTLKNGTFEMESTKKRNFILYLGNLFVTLQLEMCPMVCCRKDFEKVINGETPKASKWLIYNKV